MSNRIENITNLIAENEKENKKLRVLLRGAIYDHLKQRGIIPGERVRVRDKEEGIFSSLEFKYGKWRPVVKKIKKDGTAHATATVFCYYCDDLKPY